MDLLPQMNTFADDYDLDLFDELNFPERLLPANAHLDPDFRYLTYGDDGTGRGSGIAELVEGDLIAFYSGLKSIKKTRDNLVYALIGLYIVDRVLWAREMPKKRLHENAHTRRRKVRMNDIVVKAKQGVSGRLESCIPIGEWRNGAYRVRKELLQAWGGLSVKNGYIQRSIVPPAFLDADKFYSWFKEQGPVLLPYNNP